MVDSVLNFEYGAELNGTERIGARDVFPDCIMVHVLHGSQQGDWDQAAWATIKHPPALPHCHTATRKTPAHSHKGLTLGVVGFVMVWDQQAGRRVGTNLLCCRHRLGRSWG